MKIAALLTLAAIAVAPVANASLSKLDQNDDGLISKVEFQGFYGNERNTASFLAADSNDDGMIDAQEFAAEVGFSTGIFDDL